MKPNRSLQRLALAMLVCAGICILASSARAQSEGGTGVVAENPASTLPEDTYDTIRGLGMGLGGRAGVISTSALAYNNANLALAQLYHVEATSGFVASDGSWTLGTAIADSHTSKLAMGTSFRGVFPGGARQYKGWDWRVGFGFPLAKFILIGAGMRWANLKAESKGGVRQGPYLDTITVDTSMTLVPHEKIRLSGLAYNLVKTHSVLAPRIAGGGVSIVMLKELDIAFDFLSDLDTFEDTEYLFGGGIEYLIANSVVMRGGYKRDTGRDNHQVGGSIGYTSKSFSMESAVQHVLASEGAKDETRVLFSVRYHVH